MGLFLNRWPHTSPFWCKPYLRTISVPFRDDVEQVCPTQSWGVSGCAEQHYKTIRACWFHYPRALWKHQTWGWGHFWLNMFIHVPYEDRKWLVERSSVTQSLFLLSLNQIIKTMRKRACLGFTPTMATFARYSDYDTYVPCDALITRHFMLRLKTCL